MSNITSSVETITPQRATLILEKNKGNRNISDVVVKRYARAMRDGRWKLNGESIVIDHEGSVLNGQHRLWAIIESGCTISVLVVRGVQRDSFATFDSGKLRTGSDALSAAGYINTTRISGIVAWIRSYHELAGNLAKVNAGMYEKTDHASLIEYVERHPDVIDAPAVGYRFRRTMNGVPQVIAASFVVLIRRANPSYADTFVEELLDVGSAQTPVTELHRLIMKAPPRHFTGRRGMILFFAYLIKCWNARQLNKNVVTLRWFHDIEKFPRIIGLDIEA